MKMQLSFWEALPQSESPPVWATLDHETRASVVATLARLIVKTAIARHETIGSDGEGEDNE